MTKRDFEKIFKKGFNKEKIYFEDARNGGSEIRCFRCNALAGITQVRSGWFIRRTKVKCTNGHNFNLIEYTQLYADMIYDALKCDREKACIVQGDI